MSATISNSSSSLPVDGKEETNSCQSYEQQHRPSHENARMIGEDEIIPTTLVKDVNSVTFNRRQCLFPYTRRCTSPCSSVESNSSGSSSCTSTTRGRRRFRKQRPKRKQIQVVRSEIIFLGISEVLVNYPKTLCSTDDRSISSVSVATSDDSNIEME
jgi:hypothetical protein